jgi:uncharacterized membrane protein
MKMLHKHNYGRKTALFATALLCATAISGSASALSFGIGTVQVQDNETNSNTSQAVGELANINAETRTTTQAMREMNATLGTAGNMPTPLSGALGQAIGSDSEFYQNMERFSYDMCAVTLCENNDPVNTKDIEEAREWAMTNFFTKGTEDGSAITEELTRDLNEIRRRGLAYSTTNALSLAVTIHNELTGADGTANALETSIASSSTMRGDIQVNSSILLAQYEVALKELAVMNSALVVMAMTGINNAGLYHEEGGDTFADALNDADFTGAGFSVRRYVTVPPRGSSNAISLTP